MMPGPNGPGGPNSNGTMGGGNMSGPGMMGPGGPGPEAARDEAALVRWIVAEGALLLVGDDLEGDVSGVREMMEALGRSPLVRQSFIRHVFRYWMGRNEQSHDSKTLIAMDEAYVSSGGSFKELLVALLTSDSFLFRK